ncbi:MAG TPA: phosphatase PAP2 family protein [Nocardioides sp.]|uniref:phosphatase PAP2 family protein n=1 Tax=Nocardioides sp. TaxID=35761 RepID=UPI002BA5FE4A|nr:phosphatase PAP2 family protein [Nocardioides sp.]HTW13859.1 phosphatase PAP2 family protein [Nocardioides sp.]
MAIQTAIVTAGVFIYFQIRGLTSSDPVAAHAHAWDVVGLERWLGVDVEATAQGPLLVRPWLATAANWIYIWGHWPVIIATMVWLAWRHRREFLRLRDAMLVSGAVGLVVFVTFPVAPPRLVHSGLVDTITLQSRSYRVLQPPNFTNQYAALPSLHAGWDLLVGIAIATATSWTALRLLAGLLPVLMAYAVVATANHYVLDVVAGMLLALAGYAIALWRERRIDRAGSSP